MDHGCRSKKGRADKGENVTGNDKGSDHISADISGDVSGQVGVGKAIHQTQTVGAEAARTPTDAELAELHRAFAELKAQVSAEAPPERKGAAVERIDELEEAIIADEPDLTTVDYVKRWFTRNVPRLAGTVTGVIVNPIVGMLVGAAGDAAVREFQEILGQDPAPGPAPGPAP